MKKYLLLLLGLIPAIVFAQPSQELDPRSIWKNGTSTTTASIPFALGLSSAAPILISNGSVIAPGLGFSSDTNTGIYRIGVDNLGITTGGSVAINITNTLITMPSVLISGASSTLTLVNDHGLMLGTTTGILEAAGGSVSAITNVTSYVTTAEADSSTLGVATFSSADFNGFSGTISIDYTNAQAASAVNKGFLTAANWSTFNAKESALTFSTGLTRTTNTITVNTSQNISTLSNLTTNGFVKTSGGTGALSIDTTAYISLASISGTSPITYNSGTGAIGFDFSTNNTWTGTQYINKSDTAALKVGATPTLIVDTTNDAIGLAGAVTTTNLITIPANSKNRIIDATQTISTRATGITEALLAQNLNWSTGAAMNLGNFLAQFTLTDNHIIDSGTTDTIRNLSISTSRSGTFTSSGLTHNLANMIGSFTNSGNYTRNVSGTTLNDFAVGTFSGTFNPVYTESSAAKTLTYAATGIGYSGSATPTITNVGSLMTLTARGFYVSSLSGSTATGVTSTVNGIEVTGISTGATAAGIKIGTVSASTNAFGLQISSVPTTATGKYQIGLDSTGAGSGIYFNTPTAAGTEYLRAASSGVLEASYATTFRIKEPTGGTYAFQSDANGFVAISTNYAPQNYIKLYVTDRVTDPTVGQRQAFGGILEIIHSSANWSGGNQYGALFGVNLFANTKDFNNGSVAYGFNGQGVGILDVGRTASGLGGMFGTIQISGAGGTMTASSNFGAYTSVSGGCTVGTNTIYTLGSQNVSGGSSITTLFGYYAPALTAATNNYEFWADAGGGYYARESTQKMYSSAASTLDFTSNTTINQRVGGTIVGAITAEDAGTRAGTSTTLAKIGGTIFNHFADAGNVGTGEDDLYSDTFPASALATNGDRVNCTYFGIFAGAALSTQDLRAYFGGTKIYDTGTLAIGAVTSNWTLNTVCIRESSSVVRCDAFASSDFATLFPYSTYTRITGLTLSNTQIAKITAESVGAGSADNQTVSKGSYCNWYPAA